MTDQATPSGRSLRNPSVLGGVLVAVMALIAVIAGRRLDFGSLAEIGPGLFPVALATILLVLSIALIGSSFIGNFAASHSALPKTISSARLLQTVLAILGALVAFALTIKGFGVVPALGLTGATPVAILIAGLASHETKWRGLLVFAIVLTTFCTLLFRFLLGLPLPVAPWILGY